MAGAATSHRSNVLDHYDGIAGPAVQDSKPAAVDDFYTLVSMYPNLEWIAPSLEIANIAARIRAEYQLRRPNALQAETAVRSGATGVITNHLGFERVKSFEALVLENLL